MARLHRRRHMVGAVPPPCSFERSPRRHDDVWAQWDALVEINEKDPGIDALCEESGDLEREIVVTPAFTAAGLAGKRRIVERSELQECDNLDLIEVILRLDAQRVALAG
jgi:hypothetical protein